MSIWKLILNQAGSPGITKDELKTIVICHVTRVEIAAVCVTKVVSVNTPAFHQENQGEKEIEETKD